MRWRRVSLITALGTAIAGQAFAADSAATAQETEIHVTQRADKSLPRDRIHVTLRVEAEGGDPAHLQAEINLRMAEALAKARQVAGLETETGGYAIYQENRQGESPKWRASQSLSFAGADFAAALALTGELQKSGLLIDGLAFDVAPATLAAAETELTDKALRLLRARVEHIAAVMGMTVERYAVLDIGNATAQEFRPPMPAIRMTATSAMSSAPPPAAEAGESTAWVSIDARVELVPKKSP